MKSRSYLLIFLITGVTLLSGCITSLDDTGGRIPTLVISWVDHSINSTNQINITDIYDVPILGSTVQVIMDDIPDGDTHREQTISQQEWDQIERRFELLNLVPSNKSPTSWILYINDIPFWIEIVYIIPH